MQSQQISTMSTTNLFKSALDKSDEIPVKKQKCAVESVSTNQPLPYNMLDVPMPSYESSTVIPSIFKLKSKLAQLEEKIYRENGPLMKAKLESILADLDGTDFETVLAALKTLRHMLASHNKIAYYYEPYLTGQADRIVRLLAKQLRHVLEIHQKTIPEHEVESLRNDISEHKEFLSLLCNVFHNLAKCSIKLGSQVSVDALYELIKAVLPFVVWTLNSDNSSLCNLVMTIEHSLLERMLLENSYTSEKCSDLSCSSYLLRYNHSKSLSDTAELNVCTIIAAFLRLYREFFVDSLKEGVSSDNKSILDFLGDLLGKCDLPNIYDRMPQDIDLSVVIYEAYQLFEVYSGIPLSLDMNIEILEHLKHFLTMRCCATLRDSGMWDEQFTLVNEELKQMKRPDDQVALYKWMVSRGWARFEVDSNGLKKIKKMSAEEMAAKKTQKKSAENETGNAFLAASTELASEPSKVAPEQASMTTSTETKTTTSIVEVIDREDADTATNDGGLMKDNQQIKKAVPASAARQPEPEVICLAGTSSTGSTESEDQNQKNLKMFAESIYTELDMPMPSYESSTVVPLIFELKSELAQLEEEIYRENGPLMKAKLESIFADLDGTDFETVLAALETLCEMLDHYKKIAYYSYEPFLTSQVDRIVRLLAKQLRHFLEIYQKTIPESEVNVRLCKISKHLKFIRFLCNIFRNLTKSSIKLGSQVSVDALCELIKATLPFGVWNLKFKFNSDNFTPLIGVMLLLKHCLFEGMLSRHSYTSEKCSNCPSYLLRHNRSKSLSDTAELNVCTIIAAFLRLYREFFVNSLKEGVSSDNKSILDFFDNLLGKCDLPNIYERMPRDIDLSVVIYEAYQLFEVYSGIPLSLDMNMKTLEHLKQFLTIALPDSEMWDKQFSLVDEELKQMKRPDDQVALYKWMVSCGWARFEMDSNGLKKIVKVIDLENSDADDTDADDTDADDCILMEDKQQTKETVPASAARQPEPEVICLAGPSSTGSTESKVIVIPTEQTDLDDNSQTLIEAVKPTAILDTANSKIVDNEPPKDANSVTRDEVNKQVELMKIQMEESRNLVEKLMAMHGIKRKYAE